MCCLNVGEPGVWRDCVPIMVGYNGYMHTQSHLPNIIKHPQEGNQTFFFDLDPLLSQHVLGYFKFGRDWIQRKRLRLMLESLKSSTLDKAIEPKPRFHGKIHQHFDDFRGQTPFLDFGGFQKSGPPFFTMTGVDQADLVDQVEVAEWRGRRSDGLMVTR